MGEQDLCISCISTVTVWSSLRLQLFSIIIGFWVLTKRFLKWLWNPNAFSSLQNRDNPPACLVNSSFGHHSYVKLKGVKLHYVESGDKSQPLLLLLHGFPDCWLSWRHQIKPLSESFHVIALDLKGFGDSDKPSSRKSYRIETLLSELNQFISAFGVASCILVGHDLGALLGWYFVHKYPDIVSKFVAISCTHPNYYVDSLSSQSTFNYRWLNFIQLPYLPEIDALKDDLKLLNDCYKHLQVKDSKDSNTIMEAYKYSFSRSADWTGPINYFRNIPFTKISDNCKQITVPTLLISGNQDQFIKLEGIVKSTDFCQKFVMKIVEGAGHFPHQEKPDVFNGILSSYLIVRQNAPKVPVRTASKGLMDRMLGAVTNTVKYGNSVLDVVQKKTNLAI